MTGTGCGTMINQPAHAVGYGKESDIEYFIVQNSWGTDWGYSGYMYIAYDIDDDDTDGVLGIMQDPQTI